MRDLMLKPFAVQGVIEGTSGDRGSKDYAKSPLPPRGKQALEGKAVVKNPPVPGKGTAPHRPGRTCPRGGQFFPSRRRRAAAPGTESENRPVKILFTNPGNPSTIERNCYLFRYQIVIEKLEGDPPLDPKKKYRTLDMCHFCSREIATCGALPIFAKELDFKDHPIQDGETVVACDRYESPVDVLKRQFH